MYDNKCSKVFFLLFPLIPYAGKNVPAQFFNCPFSYIFESKCPKAIFLLFLFVSFMRIDFQKEFSYSDKKKCVMNHRALEEGYQNLSGLSSKNHFYFVCDFLKPIKKKKNPFREYVFQP